MRTADPAVQKGKCLWRSDRACRRLWLRFPSVMISKIPFGARARAFCLDLEDFHNPPLRNHPPGLGLPVPTQSPGPHRGTLNLNSKSAGFLCRWREENILLSRGMKPMGYFLSIGRPQPVRTILFLFLLAGELFLHRHKSNQRLPLPLLLSINTKRPRRNSIVS